MPSIVFKCHSISFIAVTTDVEAFLDWLPGSDKGKFESAATHAALSIGSGRPPARRWQRVRGSKELYELKVTPPGSTGPQLRLLCAQEGDQVLLLVGLVKKQRGLPPREIRRAQAALARHREAPDERKRASDRARRS